MLRVFPNPTSGSIQLSKSIGQAELFHINGMKLATFNTDESLNIDLDEFQAGSYLLRSLDGRVTQQIVLVK
jgi:hypothetical protein